LAFSEDFPGGDPEGQSVGDVSAAAGDRDGNRGFLLQK